MEENRIASPGDTGGMGGSTPEEMGACAPETNNGTEKNNLNQNSGSASAAGGAGNDDRTAEREEYDRLIKTRFRDFYTEDTQRMINRRFKHYKALAEKYKTLEDSFSHPSPSRISDEELLEKIRAGADEISAKHSDFSLDEACSSEQFISLARLALEGGSISLSQAYKLSFFDKLLTSERERVERETEQRIYDKIRSGRARGLENAVLPRTGARSFSASRLTKNDRAELARRAANGEKIGF